MKTLLPIVVLGLCMLMLAGCSSTNLNSFRTEFTGGWVKASPTDANSPGKIEIGMGYASFTLVPMARGQGARFTAITYELISGHPLFAEEIVIYPVGQDSILKLSNEPQSILKIPFLLDIKAGKDTEIVNPTKIELTPVEKK